MANPRKPAKIFIKPLELANAVSVPVSVIHALADAGYLCKVPNRGMSGYRIAKSKPLKNLPIRVVDRVSILLWQMGLDVGKTFPVFDIYAEMELQRIARLPVIPRMEQALKFLRRYRDVEEIVEALAKARSDDVAAVETKHMGAGVKDKLKFLAGLESRGNYRLKGRGQSAPTPSRSFELVRAASPVESRRKRPRSVDR